MIYRIADNIICPLGGTSETVYEAMLAGKSSSRLHEGEEGGLEPYFASVFEKDLQFAEVLKETDGMTRLETLMACSVDRALKQLADNGFAGLDPSSPRVLFIVSTTKGNIGLLKHEDGFSKDERLLLSHSADVLRRRFSNPNRPLTVSNACISGLSAQIVADRQLSGGKYDFAIVVGADLLCPFIISGFQSFKALSRERTRSFDASRDGLNLGEAAATLVFASREAACKVGTAAGLNGKYVALAAGAIANDATHISAPSRTGEGLFRTLDRIKPALEGHKAGLICAHGTATAYNDAMEAVAISRACLDGIPVNSLKGYIGHTLGAAGVVETVVSMYEMCYGNILPVPGYHENGVPVALDVVSSPQAFEGDAFIKTVSGFGGCNVSAVFVAGNESGFVIGHNVNGMEAETVQESVQESVQEPVRTRIAASLRTEASGTSPNDMYRRLGIDYPKFFKMDMLSRLGFIVAEQLLGDYGGDLDDAAIILAGRHASLDDDVKYLSTIAPGNYYPSPVLFVYTLANIVAGEIAIRHGMHGETSFYIADSYDAGWMESEAERIIAEGKSSRVLFGWLDWYDGKGTAELSLMERACKPND